jgi:hypothetical protein
MRKDTKLIETREPNIEEKERGAEIVFIREDINGEEYTILGSACYESWEQWGVKREVLGDNVEDIEQWRQNIW